MSELLSDKDTILQDSNDTASLPLNLLGNSSSDQVFDKLVPGNWEEIADLRLQILQREYEECVNAEIKNKEPEKYQGLESVLKESESESDGEEEDFGDFHGSGGYQALDDDQDNDASDSEKSENEGRITPTEQVPMEDEDEEEFKEAKSRDLFAESFQNDKQTQKESKKVQNASSWD